MKGVTEHLEESKEYFNTDRIVGIFYQGSGNYGLDYEHSDIDTKLIVTPTFKDIAFNRSPVSTTHVRANEEHDGGRCRSLDGCTEAETCSGGDDESEFGVYS